MKNCIKMLFLITLGLILWGCGSSGGGSGDANIIQSPGSYYAFSNVLWGWEPTLVYEHDIVYPSAICEDGNGDLLIADSALKKIIKVSQSSYALSTLIDTSSLNGKVISIAYQPNNNRLLIGTDSAYIYAYSYGSSTVSLLKSSIQGFHFNRTSCFAVDPTDDSFYGGSQINSQINTISKYGANGTLINQNIATNTQGVFQMDYNPTENTLYFSETFTGKLRAVSGNGGTVTDITSNIGIAGTFEPISTVITTSNSVYSYDAMIGLAQHTNTGSSLKVVADCGAGPIEWWSTENMVVIGQGAGANIKKFNFTSGQTENLTDYVNATSLVKDNTGRILYSNQDKIMLATANGISVHHDFSGPFIDSMTYVSSENCNYVFLNDGSIYHVYDNGSSSIFTTSPPGVCDATYSATSNTIYSARSTGAKNFNIESYQLSSGSPTNVNTIDNTNYTDGNGQPRLTTDDNGNLYFLIREGTAPNIAANIYKYDISNTRTTMFADIFASDSNGDAITVPDIQYSSNQNFLLVSTINDIRYWTICGTQQDKIFAVNNGAVDNFTLTQDNAGDIYGIQSGRVFKFTYNN